MKKIILPCLLLISASPGALAAYYPIEGYDCNWLNPRYQTECTASRGGVTAKLRIDSEIFDGGPGNNVRGKLEISINNKKRQEIELGPMRDMRGPHVGL